MPPPDLVTVVIPTRNRRDDLRRAIASVKAQTWSDLEIVVVDDGSTDDTARILAEMATVDPTLRVIRHETSRGGAAARNQGIEAARGRWVAFLDDDDTWLPRKLEAQLRALHAEPKAVAAACAYYYCAPWRPERVARVKTQATIQGMLSSNTLGGASVCVARTETLRAIGGFDAQFRSGQDWDLWLRLFREGTIVCCDEPLARYRSHLGPRISNDMASLYAGRRRGYFRYRSLMTSDTRRRNLAGLFYCRACAAHAAASDRWRNLRRVFRLAGPREGFTYFLWFIRARTMLRGLG
jgi:glycosyltransferase involved in cell wall biosynthesis